MQSSSKKSKIIICLMICVVLMLNILTIGTSASESKSSEAFIPQEAYTFGGHSYMFYSGSLTWDQAVDYCEEVGGHLATITSQEEWSFIQEIAKEKGGHFWLGATDKNYNGDWRWITGEAWQFTAWSNEYPNSDSEADYLYISSTRDYMWYNWEQKMDNNANEGFICEWDVLPSKTESVFIPDDVYAFNEHQYKFYPYSMTWHEAKEFCETVGGHLAVVTTEEEWSFIQSKAIANTGHFWLGATDEKLEGEWKWITGEPWSFTAWSDEYPNSNSDADYLYISSTREYMWYNWAEEMDNNAKEGFVCEWDYCCKSDNGYFTTHDWSEWTTTKEATCDNPGSNNRRCRECGAVETQAIEQLTHIYGDLSVVSGSKLIPPIVKERQCSLCGNIEQVKDWSFVWVPIVCGVVAIFAIFGIVNYIRILKKGKTK